MDNMYRIFGLNIASAISLPGPPARDPQRAVTPDVVIEYGNTPADLSGPRSKGVRFQAGKDEFLLRVDGVACYYVKNGSAITIMPEAGADEDDVLIFLMGSAMGALLHQRNTLVLHAGAIAVNGKSVVFSGPSGIGKSTLAAGFHQRGYPFLADDVCAITIADGHPAVIPGFPCLKLWADCLKRLDADRDELKGIRRGKGLEKYFLPVENVQAAPVPLQSVFILETTNTDTMEIVALKGGEKIDPLIGNTYRRRLLDGLGGTRDHFTQCAAVAAKAAVYRTVRPRSGFLLDDLMDLVEAKFLS
jgi:hypothetical protein